MSGSGETSCRMSSIGKIAWRSSGPAGSRVCGFSGGICAPGMSGTMLIQCVGIESSASRNFVCWAGMARSYAASAARRTCARARRTARCRPARRHTMV